MWINDENKSNSGTSDVIMALFWGLEFSQKRLQQPLCPTQKSAPIRQSRKMYFTEFTSSRQKNQIQEQPQHVGDRGAEKRAQIKHTVMFS